MVKAVGVLKTQYTQTVQLDCGGATGKPKKSPVKRHHVYSGANISANCVTVADDSKEFSIISSKTPGTQQSGSKKQRENALQS